MKRTPFVCLIALAVGVANAQEKPNPFTGTTAAFEQRLRVLEEKKLDAAIANEELAAEKANQERLRLRTGRGLGGPELFGLDPVKPVQKALPPQGLSAPLPPATTKPRPPRFVGTVWSSSGWVALIETGERVLSIAEGATVAGVKANDIARDRAIINGVAMALETVTARIATPAASVTPTPRGTHPGIPTAPMDVIDLGTGSSRK